jgi:ubiquinone/menaquinone biosynthesis C-methylase UbiE
MSLWILILLLVLLYVYLSSGVTKCQEMYNGVYAEMYDTVWYDKKRYKSEVDYISKNIGSKHPETLLDLGCGTGNHMKFWQQKWGDVDVTGVDLSLDQISRARVKNPNVHIIQGSYLDRHTWGDDKFDMITCMYGAGQYTDANQTLLENVYKWLKPGGTFVFHGIDPRRLCDGCDQTASNTDLPLRVDRKGHCTVLYPGLVYTSWWTRSMFSKWVRYNETFYKMKGNEWPKDWDTSGRVGSNVPLGMRGCDNFMTNGHSLYLRTPHDIAEIGRHLGFSSVKVNPIHGIRDFIESSQGSEEYFIFFKK